MPGFQTITMYRTPCYGRCPVYRLELNNQGLFSYFPIRFTPRTDTFTLTLSVESRRHVSRRINKLKFKSLHHEYPHANEPVPQDLPSIILTFQEFGEPDTITIRGAMGEGLPSELSAFINYLDSLWLKVP